MSVTIKDVSIDAGVSIKTVSRVINNEPNVAHTTKSKVLISIDKLGFKPNKSAQTLRLKKSYIAGRVLLIDIGGTNVRSAQADVGSTDLINVNKQKLDSLDSFDKILLNFLDADPSIKHIVFSVAGPRFNNSISMTNRKFSIDTEKILRKFSVDSCHILNDWESIGHSFSLFSLDEMKIVNPGKSFNDAALIIGPGTGLGAAQVIGNDIVLPTEIGNSSFKIPNLLSELGILNDTSFNVVEDLISGSGLSKIYSYFTSTKKTSEQIVATYNQDQFSQKSINIFLIAFSQILSELALIYMPGKGIYIMGSLMRNLHTFIDTQIFMNNFLINRKSMHADILAQIPIALIENEMTCLHGSLNFINKLNQKDN
jgi:glucokinase